MSDRKLALIEDVKKFLEENGELPTWYEIEHVIGVPRRTVRRFFGNLESLFDVVLTEGELIFTDQRADSVKDVIKQNTRFFISTIVSGAPKFEAGMKAISTWKKKVRGVSLFLPCADPAAETVSAGVSEFLGENLVIEQVDLNSNIGIETIRLSAKQINPTTGLGRFGQRNKSFIFASPKQSLEYVPVGNNAIPHALMSTGAITLPDYGTDRYMSKRTAFIADHDHVMGGVIVEVASDKTYHFRHVEFNADGSFSDLGVRYYPDGKVVKAPVSVMTLGDWHTGHTSEMVRETTFKMIAEFKPENLVLHDFMDGSSVNVHVTNQTITKAKIKAPSILEEGAMLRADLLQFSKCSSIKNVYVVKSNHDIWIDRYLEAGAYLHDSRNLRTALQLAIQKIDGIDMVKALVDISGGAVPKVQYLKRDQDLIFNKVQYGAHGDHMHKGLSYDQAERAYGSATIGHRHTAGKRRGINVVGTSTALRESYATGPISWTHTHEIMGEDGKRQLINVIDGKYRL